MKDADGDECVLSVWEESQHLASRPPYKQDVLQGRTFTPEDGGRGGKGPAKDGKRIERMGLASGGAILSRGSGGTEKAAVGVPATRGKKDKLVKRRPRMRGRARQRILK